MVVKLKVSATAWDDVWSRMDNAYKNAGDERGAQWAIGDDGTIGMNGIRLEREVEQVPTVQFPSFTSYVHTNTGEHGWVCYHSPSGEYCWAEGVPEAEYLEDVRPATAIEKWALGQLKEARADLAEAEDGLKNWKKGSAEDDIV